MTDRQRNRDMSDEELEGLISALPRRGPSPPLRQRILSQAARRQPRRLILFRPAFALGALVLLLAVDVLVVRWQDASLRGPAGGKRVVVAAAAEREDSLGFLDDIAGSGVSLRIALRSVASEPRASYFELRRSMLEKPNGG